MEMIGISRSRDRWAVQSKWIQPKPVEIKLTQLPKWIQPKPVEIKRIEIKWIQPCALKSIERKLIQPKSIESKPIERKLIQRSPIKRRYPRPC